MTCEDKPLKVINGNIYTQDGIEIDNMAVIFSKYAGIMRYGDTAELRKYYNDVKESYISAGLYDMLEGLIFVEFDKNKTIITTEEICVLVNYMVMCSCNATRITQLMSMDEYKLKDELNKLREYGF